MFLVRLFFFHLFTLYKIRAVAKYRKKSMQELFVDLKFHICKFMVDTVVKQQQEATSEENDTCLNVFNKICRVFDFKSVKALMQVFHFYLHFGAIFLALFPPILNLTRFFHPLWLFTGLILPSRDK